MARSDGKGLRRSINPLTAIPTKNKKITILFWCEITVDSWLQHSFCDMLWNCHDKTIFLTSQILCFPRTERRYHSTLIKLLKFQIKRVNSILVLFAVKTTPSLAGLVRDISEWNGPSLHVLQTFSAHQKEWSPGLFSSVVPWTRLVHILEWFPSCFRDNFYLESDTIQGTACFRHNDKTTATKGILNRLILWNI